MADASPGGGLLDSLRGLASTLVEMARSRLALVSNELEEQGATFARVAMHAGIAIGAFFFASILGIAFIVELFHEHRLAAIGGLFILFACVGAGCALSARSLLANRPRMFAATLAELEKDKAALGVATAHAASTNPATSGTPHEPR
jgi:uncharacterized membrane protein YqjE